VNQDGVYKYYEVILVDPNHKAVGRPLCSSVIFSLQYTVRFAVIPVSTGLRSPYTNAGRLVDSRVLANKFVSSLLVCCLFTNTFRTLEPRLGQGSPSQPHSCSVYLEKTQHTQPPSLPLIPVLLYAHVSHTLYGCMSSEPFEILWCDSVARVLIMTSNLKPLI
jgi:hypothetical protein